LCRGEAATERRPDRNAEEDTLANQGVKDASELLASAYFKGAEAMNISRDIDEGIEWHKLAAEQGTMRCNYFYAVVNSLFYGFNC